MRRWGLVPLVLIGCVHMEATPIGGDTGPPPGSARAMFDNNVYPILATDCASCHEVTASVVGIGFVSPDPANAYQTLMAQPNLLGDFTTTGTPLITAVQDTHVPDYTPEELVAIEQWLGAERAERGL